MVIIRSIEYNVEWITDLIEYMGAKGFTRAEATADAVASWYQYVLDQGEGLLSNEVDSWMTGINSNVPGKRIRIVGGRYGGSVQSYRGLCDRVAADNYRTMTFS